MLPNLRVLTLIHIGSQPSENMRITLSSYSIKMVTAKEGRIQDRDIKITTVYFSGEKEVVTFNLSDFDLLQLETVVGQYDSFND